MKQKQDLRVVKTRKNIENTFLELLQKHDFEKITVRMIIEDALVSRITFYNHYEDKYDLARGISQKYLDTMKSDMNARYESAISGQLPADAITSLSHAMPGYEKMYLTMKKLPQEVLDVDEAIQQIISDILSDAPLPTAEDPEKRELTSLIVSSLVMTYWKYCMTHDDPLPLPVYISVMQDVTAFYSSHNIK